MGDILSQSEIDELLNALNQGSVDTKEAEPEVHERKIKVLDFKRPNKFAKDHLKTLHIINENFARLVTNFLSGYLRSLVQFEVLSVEEMTYNEFSNSVSNPVALGIIDFNPLPGSVILELSPNVAFSLIDRILGGRGYNMDKLRSFTEIEIAVLERIVIQMLGLMKEPWQNVIDVKPRLDRMETNSQFAQIMSPNEMVALITFNAKIGESEGMINLCIPYQVVESIVSKLSTRFWFSITKNEITDENKHLIEKKIETTKVPLKALLGETTLTVGEILEIQPGDVVQLDTNINSELDIYVGDLIKFKARPGVKTNRISIKITNVIRREE
jgi:flagellar motor switch protein FliM